ncbi:MAG: cyclase family protein [Firmicutes bacterium]|nr:cyclase family protein [Bacillota bacterium]
MEKKVYDLTHEIQTGMMEFPGDPEIVIEEALVHDTDYCHVNRLQLGSHSGTHIDSPYHFIEDGKRINDYPITKFTGRAVVMDISGRTPGAPVTSLDVQNIKHRVRPGDILIVKSGMNKEYGSPAYLRHPYFPKDAAQAIVDLGISIVAVDFLNVDPTLWEDWQAHPIFLSNDVLIVENLAGTEQLTDRIEYDAYFMPLRIADSDGAPIRAMVVEREKEPPKIMKPW